MPIETGKSRSAFRPNLAGFIDIEENAPAQYKALERWRRENWTPAHRNLNNPINQESETSVTNNINMIRLVIIRLMKLLALATLLLAAPALKAHSPLISEEKTKFSQGDSKTEIIVLDVRTPPEHQESAILGALNIDVTNSNFTSRIEALDKNKTYKLYCRSGRRSGRAEKIMRERGFLMVENLGSISQAAKMLGKSCTPKACP